MDVVVPSICFSSLAGALLFYAGGRLNGGAAAAAPEEPRAIEPGIEEERAARERAEQAAFGAAKATREAVAALAEERARTTALREELTAERDARRRADAEATNDRRRLVEEAARLREGAMGAAEGRAQIEARAVAASVELEKAGREIARLRAEVEKATSAARRASGETAAFRAKVAEQEGALAGLGAAKAELGAARAELGAAKVAAEKSVAEAASLRDENAKLREELASCALEKAAAPDLAEVQRRTVTATMALRSLEQRSGEIARREEENTELRRRVEELTAAAAEAEGLRRQVRDLLAQGYARRPAHTLESEGAEGGGLAPELETGLEAGLRALRRAEPGCRTAVLSDERGLLVAAQGEDGYRLELAAAAALTTTAAERLRELLPIGEPAAMTVVDVHATELRTRWLRWNGECFLLSTIGVARDSEDVPAETLREELARLIGR